MSNLAQPPSKVHDDGVARVDELLDKLERNLEDARVSLEQQETLLGQIKVRGRNPATATPIFTKRGITILSKYGLGSDGSSVACEALRCLANAFLLNELCRQTFVDLGLAPALADRYKSTNADGEFLISRILFLLTYNTKLDFRELVDKHALADSISQHLQRHAQSHLQGTLRTESQAQVTDGAALTETLKLLFNVTYYYPDLVSRFSPSIRPLIELLQQHDLPQPPLQPPIAQLLNALLNLDLKATNATSPSSKPAVTADPLFPPDNPELVVSRLVSILDQAIRQYPERELETNAAPLCTLLRHLYEVADANVKGWMRSNLLPGDADRDKPLGKSETLPSRLLRLSISPQLLTLHDNIASLLFELSDKDPDTFVQNVGYGYASGFLVNHGLGVPASVSGGQPSARQQGRHEQEAINPVTGQKLSAEERDQPRLADMTDEEKEREAERLFVLFERLRATGVVDVKNPVQQAVDEGRFEELPD